jgi:hypothetical protein
VSEKGEAMSETMGHKIPVDLYGADDGDVAWVPHVARDRDATEWREVVAAIGQEISNQIAPVKEGYAHLPVPALDALYRAQEALDEFDRHMWKVGRRRAVGGKYKLVRVLKRVEAPGA